MRLLLFDFDGVLVDSLDVYEKTVTLCLAKIHHPLKRGREEFLELFDGNFYEMLAQKGVDLDKFMTASVDILSQVSYSEMKPFAAMHPVLAQLRENNLLLVISSNDTTTINEALKIYNYDGIFREILGSDFMLSKKDKILYAIKKYQIMPEDIYYIGDTIGDIVEGKQAGIKTIGVTWGWHDKIKMASSKPDYLFDDPQELLQLTDIN